MGYQNVGTPRFYINHWNYWLQSGLGLYSTNLPGDDKKIRKLMSLNPSNTQSFDFTEWVSGYYSFRMASPYNKIEDWNLNYMAVLGHNLKSAGASTYINGSDGTNVSEMADKTEIVNWEFSTTPLDSDGWSLMEFGGFDTGDYYQNPGFILHDVSGNGFDDIVQIGAVSVGRYYDMPNSPDLSLTVTHEYGGINTMETKGGASLSNALWTKPSDWGNLQAWQLGDWDWINSGRRVWDLSFSYVSDENLEPQNYTGTNLDVSHNPGSDNFFQHVLFYTNGGQLPFLFCPDPSVTYDSNTWTVPELAICKLDMNSFSRKQVAHKVYNIKVKIREVW